MFDDSRLPIWLERWTGQEEIQLREKEAKEGNTNQRKWMRIYYSLYSQMLDINKLLSGFKKVRRAKGAAGIDGQSLSEFGLHLKENLQKLQHELQTKQYHPQAVKRVEIAKPNGGMRLLGIPSVRDRVVQQVLLEILQPIFEEDFHPSSYGYRPR